METTSRHPVVIPSTSYGISSCDVPTTKGRDLIAQAGRYDTTHTRLICFSGAGFNDKAHTIADGDPAVQLIDPAALYGQV